jgi:peptide-methionine (S)-S-oxide reductase
MAIATLGAGCFWCVEACFSQLKGVSSVVPGYCGGTSEFTSYEDVCKGMTGHAEVCQIEFDETVITFPEILKVFFFIHDPTSLNRQGEDVGTQYRSAIFYHDEAQLKSAKLAIDHLTENKVYSQAIVTTLEPYRNYSSAEAYHFNYFARNPGQPYCERVVRPKVEKFEKAFKDILL